MWCYSSEADIISIIAVCPGYRGTRASVGVAMHTWAVEHDEGIFWGFSLTVHLQERLGTMMDNASNSAQSLNPVYNFGGQQFY